MQRTIKRKTLVGGMSAVALAVVLSSAAYACTVFKGEMELSPATGAGHTPSATGYVHGWGDGVSMEYCPSPNGNPKDGVVSANAGDWVKVTVKPHVCGGTNYKLSPNTSDVNFVNGQAFTDYSNRNWMLDCMSDQTTNVVGRGIVRNTLPAQVEYLGAITINATGNGTTEVRIPTGADPNLITTTIPFVPNDESAICVSTHRADGWTATPEGMELPITITPTLI